MGHFAHIHMAVNSGHRWLPKRGLKLTLLVKDTPTLFLYQGSKTGEKREPECKEEKASFAFQFHGDEERTVKPLLARSSHRLRPDSPSLHECLLCHFETLRWPLPMGSHPSFLSLSPQVLSSGKVVSQAPPCPAPTAVVPVRSALSQALSGRTHTSGPTLAASHLPRKPPSTARPALLFYSGGCVSRTEEMRETDRHVPRAFSTKDGVRGLRVIFLTVGDNEVRERDGSHAAL